MHSEGGDLHEHNVTLKGGDMHSEGGDMQF